MINYNILIKIGKSLCSGGGGGGGGDGSGGGGGGVVGGSILPGGGGRHAVPQLGLVKAVLREGCDWWTH